MAACLSSRWTHQVLCGRAQAPVKVRHDPAAQVEQGGSPGGPLDGVLQGPAALRTGRPAPHTQQGDRAHQELGRQPVQELMRLPAVPAERSDGVSRGTRWGGRAPSSPGRRLSRAAASRGCPGAAWESSSAGSKAPRFERGDTLNCPAPARWKDILRSGAPRRWRRVPARLWSTGSWLDAAPTQALREWAFALCAQSARSSCLENTGRAHRPAHAACALLCGCPARRQPRPAPPDRRRPPHPAHAPAPPPGLSPRAGRSPRPGSPPRSQNSAAGRTAPPRATLR